MPDDQKISRYLIWSMLGYIPDPCPEYWEELTQLVAEQHERDSKTTSYIKGKWNNKFPLTSLLDERKQQKKPEESSDK